MMKFKEFRTNISETASASKETVVKSFKVKKYNAVIKKVGSKYIAYLDGDKLDDSFTNAKQAEQAIMDFSLLIGK